MAYGTLYICGTPIGNLEDVTARVLRVLGEVDLIAAEDTRIIRRLLDRYGIPSRAVSYHEHSSPAKVQSLLQQLESGKSIALVCNAGTPGISDPGAPLVKAAIARGITVSPVPGPSAVAAALSASGFPAQQFIFLGFLPKKIKVRDGILRRYGEAPDTLVLYESPERVCETLTAILQHYGDRRVAVFREMTKKFEEILHGTVAEVLGQLSEKRPRGEFTVVIEGGAGGVEPRAAIDGGEIILWLESLPQPLPRTGVLVSMLVERTGWSRNQSYRFILEWKQRRQAKSPSSSFTSDYPRDTF